MIVQLKPGAMANSEKVVSVRREFHSRFLIVSMEDGSTHEIEPQYQETIYALESRILKLLQGHAPIPAVAITARGAAELCQQVSALGEQGFRIVAVLDTQNGDYEIVAQMERSQ